MNLWVGVTDQGWFDFLSRRPDLDEVNFWQPGGRQLFKALSPGEPFLFKLKFPTNAGVPHQPAGQVLEERLVKASYDRRTDTLNVILKVDTPVAESDEPRPGIILDYDEHGDLVSLEVLDACKRVTDADRMEFQTMK